MMQSHFYLSHGYVARLPITSRENTVPALGLSVIILFFDYHLKVAKLMVHSFIHSFLHILVMHSPIQLVNQPARKETFIIHLPWLSLCLALPMSHPCYDP